MKKKYYVNVHYDVVLQAEVIAESEEQAMELAKQQTETTSLEDGDVVDVKSCITATDEIK